MDYPKLIACMMRFSGEALRKYLGEDLIDQLVSEWESAEYSSLTKKRLAEMILHLNGTAILRNPAFRKDVLFHMEERDIDLIYQELPPSRKRDSASLEQKATAITTMPWREGPAFNKLITILGVSPSIFDVKTLDETSVVTHQAEERFFELLDYQFVIKQRVLNELNKPNELKRMLVHMPTGTGKTKTTMHTLVHYFNFSLHQEGLVIWLAHTTELLQQAYDTFTSVWSHLGSGTVKAYKLWGTRDIPVGDDAFCGVMFCGIQKLQAVKQSNPALFNKIVESARLIVFDEAHKALATETRQLVESLMVKKAGMCDRSLIGLTATPGRTTLSSEENGLFSDMFEGRIIRIDPDIVNQINLSKLDYLNTETDNNIIHYFQEAGILSHIQKEQLTYEEAFTADQIRRIRVSMTINGYEDFSKTALEMIGRNRSRNAAILRKLRELSSENVPTIVFACSVTHAKLLSYMLSLESIPNTLVIGEMSATDRADAIAAFKDRTNPVNILINYEVLTTGFDSTNIRCVFITRPTQSIVLYSQMLGRGLRGPMMGGNAECLLVDVKDNLGRFNPEMAFNHFDSYWL